MAKKALVIQWVALIEFIMKIIEMIMKNKKQAEDIRALFTKEAAALGGTPDADKAAAVTELIQSALDNTKRVRPFRRALLRWVLEEVPPVAGRPRPKLSAASVSAGKKLAAADD